MSLNQFLSFAAELWQSTGVELTIFAVTLTLAMALRRTSFGEKFGGARKKMKAPSAKGKQADLGREESSSYGGINSCKRVIKHSAPQVSTATDHASFKIDSMIDCVNRRQAADAIAIYGEMRSNGQHTAIKDSMKNNRQQPADIFSQLVQCAGRVGRPELIEIFLDDMAQVGIERSLAFYESAMKMLASKKCYKEALSVCSRLEAEGLHPSPVTLSCLINFAVESGESDRAVGFFDRLALTNTPSIRAYMTILRVYSKRQDWSKSISLIRDMQHRQAPIDSLVLNVVLATGVAASQLDAARELLEEFAGIGLADTVSYNTVMKGFARQKEVNKAMELLDEMSQIKVKPNAITFNTAMDAAVRSSRLTDAWCVLARMCDAGLAPDKFTCTTLVKGLQNGATSEQLTVILDLLRNVTAECDSTLSTSLFRAVIEAAAQLNEPALTTRAVAQMREQRVMMSPQEYQRLLQVLMRDGEDKLGNTPWRRQPMEVMRPVSAC